MFVLALGGGSAHAQSIELRAYSNAPVGINFLIAGYGYAEGGLAVDASVPLTNANLQVHTTVLAYARTLDLWGRSGKVDVLYLMPGSPAMPNMGASRCRARYPDSAAPACGSP